MTGPWKGAGASIGEGLAMFTQNYIQRQDQLKQQALQEEQYRQQLEQQRLQNERAAQDDELRRQQYADSRADVTYNRDRQARLDAVGQREDEVKGALSPQVNTFMAGVDADLKRYAPTVNGAPNPQFNQALFMAAKARGAQVQKLWNAVTLAVGSGQGYDEARQALLGFVGGDMTPAAPTATPAQAAPATPAPVTVPGPSGAAFNYTPEPAPATPQASAAPSPVASPAPTQNVSSDPGLLSDDDLLELTPAQIQAAYDPATAENVIARRTQIITNRAAQEAEVQKVRMGNWTETLKNLTERKDLTGPQLYALDVITRLQMKPTLTPQEAEQFKQAYLTLTPAMYTPESWQKVLDTKDPNVVRSMLPIYQKAAPELVAGFDLGVWLDQAQADLNEQGAATERDAAAGRASDAAAANSTADAARTTELLPYEKRKMGAETDQTITETGETRTDTQRKAHDLAVSKLTQIAGTNATVFQIQKTNPQLWYQLKQGLGVNDAGLTAILQQARYMSNLSVKDKELAVRKLASDIASQDASRAKTVAETNEITTLTPIKAAEGQADIALTGAQTQQTQANTALSWARTGEIDARLKIDREKAAAYIKGVEGNYVVDMAQVRNLNARTALTQATDPNSPLYNPKIEAAKPGDPVDALKKKAGVYYTQQDNALQQADKVNTQINQIVKKYTGQFGFDDRKVTAEDRAKMDALTAERDKLLKQAAGYRQQGDNVITKGMAALKDTPGGADGKDPYGTTNVGGIQMVTTFPSKYPVPPTFNADARFHISKVAGELGVDANALAALISFETAGTFNPAAKNPNSSGSGLIQFMESTAKGMGTTTAALRGMTFGQQMQYVKQYLQGRGIGPGSSMADMYQAVAGSGYKRGTPAYDQNAVWDADKDGVIEANEQTLNPVFAGHVRDYFGTGRAAAQQGPQKPAATTTKPAVTPAAKPAAAPAKPAASTTGPLKAEASVDLIKSAANPQALAVIRDRLVAGGMTAEQATAYIRKVKTGS